MATLHQRCCGSYFAIIAVADTTDEEFELLFVRSWSHGLALKVSKLCVRLGVPSAESGLWLQLTAESMPKMLEVAKRVDNDTSN